MSSAEKQAHSDRRNQATVEEASANLGDSVPVRTSSTIRVAHTIVDNNSPSLLHSIDTELRQLNEKKRYKRVLELTAPLVQQYDPSNMSDAHQVEIDSCTLSIFIFRAMALLEDDKRGDRPRPSVARLAEAHSVASAGISVANFFIERLAGLLEQSQLGVAGVTEELCRVLVKKATLFNARSTCYDDDRSHAALLDSRAACVIGLDLERRGRTEYTEFHRMDMSNFFLALARRFVGTARPHYAKSDFRALKHDLSLREYDPDNLQCFVCGKAPPEVELSHCSRCQHLGVWYCSSACQRADWSDHKRAGCTANRQFKYELTAHTHAQLEQHLRSTGEPFACFMYGRGYPRRGRKMDSVAEYCIAMLDRTTGRLYEALSDLDCEIGS